MSRAAQVVIAMVIAVAVNIAVFLVYPSVTNHVSQLDYRPDMSGYDAAIIGSSLTRNAIPSHLTDGGGVLHDGRSYIRIGMTWANPVEIEELARDAIDAGAATIFVEARPFVYRTRNEPVGVQCQPVRCEVRGAIDASFSGVRRTRGLFQDWYRAQLGVSVRYSRLRLGEFEPGRMDAEFEPRIALSEFYPVTVTGAQEFQTLERIVQHARQNGSEVHLIMPPRSPTATSYIGAEQSAQIDQRLGELSARLDVLVFNPQLNWEDREFIDHAHLNERGRARFVAAFDRWMAGQK